MSFDPMIPLKLTCDASPYGVAAILSHIVEENKCKPIAFASKTLSKSQQNYSQIHKEAYSIFYGVNKFYPYLYDNDFDLETDHKPLVTIFGPKKGIPPMAASRLQRYALFLSGFRYKIKYVKSKDNIADALSRLPIEDNDPFYVVDTSEEINYLYYTTEKVNCLSPTLVAEETLKDPIPTSKSNFLFTKWMARKCW